MDQENYNDHVKKIHGFTPTPIANLNGSYKIYQEKIVIAVACKNCGNKITLVLHGRTDILTTEQIESRVKTVILEKHDCPAIKAMVGNNPKKYFGDIFQGMDSINSDKARTVGRC